MQADLVFDKKTVYKVSVYGVDYSLRKPTVREAEAIRKAIKDQGDEPNLETFAGFLEQLGMPKAVAGDLELEHFLKLTEFLLAGKKN
jgi:hypothetical protein